MQPFSHCATNRNPSVACNTFQHSHISNIRLQHRFVHVNVNPLRRYEWRATQNVKNGFRDFVANLLPSWLVKKFWKSDNSLWSYGEEFGVLFFFDSRCSNFKTFCQAFSGFNFIFTLCTVFSSNTHQTYNLITELIRRSQYLKYKMLELLIC